MINKIEIVQITENEIPELIYLSYKGDTVGLDEYHIKKFSLIEAVDYEVGIIKEGAKILKFTYYKTLYAGIPIGYLVACEDFVFSFALGKRYRTKEIITQWWEMVLYFFGAGVKFGVVENNKRAINFFKKRGMKVSWEDKQKKELLLTF